MGRSLLVEASKTMVDGRWNPYRSVYLHGVSQRNGSADTNCSNIRFRGGVPGSRLNDHTGGVLRSSDAYWKSIGLSVERLSIRLLIGRVQTVRFVFDSTPTCQKCLDGMPLKLLQSGLLNVFHEYARSMPQHQPEHSCQS